VSIEDRTGTGQAAGAPRTLLETWLDQARGGSSEALGALLEGCRKYLLLVANRELDSDLRPRTAASDLVQETFLEVQRGFDNFRGTTEEELFAWLKAILANRVSNIVRSHRYAAKRSVEREQPLELTPGQCLLKPRDETSPSEAAAARDEERRLQTALAALCELDREIIVRRTWEQKSFVEIGRELGKSADATRRLWGRAVRRLEQALKDTR
jgi:RNA polymerase sigma-70 factor (ECF subfamily)